MTLIIINKNKIKTNRILTLNLSPRVNFHKLEKILTIIVFIEMLQRMKANA